VATAAQEGESGEEEEEEGEGEEEGKRKKKKARKAAAAATAVQEGESGEEKEKKKKKKKVEEENARAARELACRRGRSSHREETVIQLKDENLSCFGFPLRRAFEVYLHKQHSLQPPYTPYVRGKKGRGLKCRRGERGGEMGGKRSGSHSLNVSSTFTLTPTLSPLPPSRHPFAVLLLRYREALNRLIKAALGKEPTQPYDNLAQVCGGFLSP
jgi:hypothetical protein